MPNLTNILKPNAKKLKNDTPHATSVKIIYLFNTFL